MHTRMKRVAATLALTYVASILGAVAPLLNLALPVIFVGYAVLYVVAVAVARIGEN